MHSQEEQPSLSNSHIQTEDSQSVSIIIPCFNESEGIEPLKIKLLPVLEKLRLLGSVELIFVDDGSTDDTVLKLQLCFGQLAQIVSHQSNRGIWAAILTRANASKINKTKWKKSLVYASNARISFSVNLIFPP